MLYFPKSQPVFPHVGEEKTKYHCFAMIRALLIGHFFNDCEHGHAKSSSLLFISFIHLLLVSHLVDWFVLKVRVFYLRWTFQVPYLI